MLAFPGGTNGKELARQCREASEMRVWNVGQEDPLEEGMATHSSILAWRTPWAEEPGRLQSMGSQRVRHNWESLACKQAEKSTEPKHFQKSLLIYFWNCIYLHQRWYLLLLSLFWPTKFPTRWYQKPFWYWTWHCATTEHGRHRVPLPTIHLPANQNLSQVTSPRRILIGLNQLWFRQVATWPDK